jgi:hypothetical protein
MQQGQNRDDDDTGISKYPSKHLLGVEAETHFSAWVWCGSTGRTAQWSHLPPVMELLALKQSGDLHWGEIFQIFL